MAKCVFMMTICCALFILRSSGSVGASLHSQGPVDGKNVDTCKLCYYLVVRKQTRLIDQCPLS